MGNLTVVAAKTDADLLAAIPRVLGVDTPNSLVAVVFHGNRTAGAVRVDFHDNPEEEIKAPHSVWLDAVSIAIQEIDKVALVVYTDSRLTAWPENSGVLQMLYIIRSRLELNGTEVAGAFVVGEDGWASVTSGSISGLRKLSEIQDSDAHDPQLQNPDLDEWRKTAPGANVTAKDIGKLARNPAKGAR